MEEKQEQKTKKEEQSRDWGGIIAVTLMLGVSIAVGVFFWYQQILYFISLFI